MTLVLSAEPVVSVARVASGPNTGTVDNAPNVVIADKTRDVGMVNNAPVRKAQDKRRNRKRARRAKAKVRPRDNPGRGRPKPRKARVNRSRRRWRPRRLQRRKKAESVGFSDSLNQQGRPAHGRPFAFVVTFRSFGVATFPRCTLTRFPGGDCGLCRLSDFTNAPRKFFATSMG